MNNWNCCEYEPPTNSKAIIIREKSTKSLVEYLFFYSKDEYKTMIKLPLFLVNLVDEERECYEWRRVDE
jgi:hypothetical protein